MPLTSTEIAAARALLGWEQRNLAFAAGIGVGTVRRMEEGSTDFRTIIPRRNFLSPSRRQVIGAISEALESAGVRFMTMRGNTTEIAIGLEPWAGQDELPFKILVVPWHNEARPFSVKTTFIRYGFTQIRDRNSKRVWVITELPSEPGAELSFDNTGLIERAATYATTLPRVPYSQLELHSKARSTVPETFWVLARSKPVQSDEFGKAFVFEQLTLDWLEDERRLALSGKRPLKVATDGSTNKAGSILSRICTDLEEAYAHVNWTLFPKSEARRLQFGPQSWAPSPIGESRRGH